MKGIYPALFHKEEGKYWVEFPDLPGCFTQGDNLEDALRMAEEVLSLFLFQLQEDGESTPVPSEPSAISTEKDSFVTLVEARLIELIREEAYTKVERINVSIPRYLRDIAATEKVNLSRVLTDTLQGMFGLWAREISKRDRPSRLKGQASKYHTSSK